MKHGTKKAIAAGCECDSCRLMARVYDHGRLAKRPSECSTAVLIAPFQVVLLALQAHGHSVPMIAAHCGLPGKTIYRVLHGDVRFIHESTAARLRRMASLFPIGEVVDQH